MPKPLHKFFNFNIFLAMTYDHFVDCVLGETFCIFKQRILNVKHTSLKAKLLKKKEACRYKAFILQRRTQKDKQFKEIIYFIQMHIMNYSYWKSVSTEQSLFPRARVKYKFFYDPKWRTLNVASQNNSCNRASIQFPYSYTERYVSCQKCRTFSLPTSENIRLHIKFL